MRGVIGGGEARQRHRHIAHAERGRDGHDRAEHQHRLHVRQGDVVQLLPAVADAIHIARLVLRAVNALQTCDEGKETRGHAHPQRDDDDDRHDVIRRRQPENRGVEDAQLHQDGVQVAVRVAAEDDGEDIIGIARNGRRVEDDDGNRAHPARQFVDEPREAERHDVAHRPCNHRQQERVFHCSQENIILQNQGDVVVHPDEARGLQNVVVGEGVVDGDEHREDVESQKQQGVGRQKRIAELHVLRSVPRDARIALSQRKVLFPERGHDECFLLSLRASLRRSADRTPSASY